MAAGFRPERLDELAAQVPGLDLSDYVEWPLQARLNPRAKRLRLAVRDARIDLVIPPGVSGGLVNRFVEQHRDWISKQLRTQNVVQDQARKALDLNPTNARIPLWGRTMPVHCRPGSPRVELLESAIEVGLDPQRKGAPQALARLLQGAMKSALRQHLGLQLPALQQALGLRASGLRIRPLRSLWGSLSPAGMVSMNLGLVFLPSHYADYVLAHELAHLRQRNHSPAFWRVVQELYPDWRSARASLRAEHGYVQALSDRLFAAQ